MSLVVSTLRSLNIDESLISFNPMLWRSEKKTLPEKLRVCIVTKRLPMSGLATDYGYLWHLCRNLVKAGHDITVIATEKPSHVGYDVTIEGVRILYLDPPFSELHTPTNQSILDPLEHLHLENPFHLIHCADDTGKLLGFVKDRLGCLLAVDIKATRLDGIISDLGMTEETVPSYISTSISVTLKFLRSYFGSDRKFLGLADGIFVTSNQQREILERFYRLPASRVHVIPFGIDPKQFQPAPSKSEIAKELGLDPETRIILTIDPLENFLETRNLLDSFERLVVKKPKSALLILGNGPRKFDLEAHMLDLALASKVFFLDQVPQEKVNSFINACDVYVSLGSRSSGFEPAVLEAMACCKTVIASEVGTASNVIRSGIDGFLLRPTETAALSRLLLQIVSGQIETLPIGERARQKIIKMFDTEQMVDQTIKAYNNILLRSGRYRK